MAGVAVVIILAAMAGSWLSRGLLLRVLRSRHAHVFAELGQPSTRQLASVHPRHGNLQILFWTYLWSGRVFGIGDRLVSALALVALLADAALAAGVVALLWSAGR